jgi:hypothetical protein
MERLNRRRAKQSGSAEVRIEYRLRSFQCENAREWETSTYIKNIDVRASAYDRHINNKMTVWSREVYTNHIPLYIEKLPTEYGGPPTASPAP